MSPPTQQFCVKAVRKQSFPRCRHSLKSLWPHLPSCKACRLDKHCQKNFREGSWRTSFFLIPPYVFMYLSSLCRIKEKGAPFSPLNKVIFANREFTASLQALCELPASIWTGDHSALFSGVNTDSLPVYPLLSLSPSSSPASVFHSIMSHTHRTNSCYAT